MSKRSKILWGASACALVGAAVAVSPRLSFIGLEDAKAQGPAGCGGSSTCSRPAPRLSTPAPAVSDSFAGTWTGKGDGAEAVVKIAVASGSGYSVEHEIDSKTGCVASIEGTGNAKGNLLTLKVPDSEGNICTVTYAKVANRLTVQEDGCLYSHPAACSFDGAVTRKSVATSPVASAAQPVNWLVGAWVAKGASCASSDSLMFNKDGTYFSGYDVNGRWKISGGRLHVVFTEGDPDGPQKQTSPLIAQRGANEMTLGGTLMRRCPPNGGPEPWNPKQRFTVD